MPLNFDIYAEKAVKHIATGLDKFSNCGFIKNQIDKYSKDRGGYVAMFGVVSNCLKDAVGGYFYVKQSLQNEKIPKERRGFVAALDLTNTFLMIGTQIALGYTISSPKLQGKLKEKLFRFFDDENFKKKIIMYMQDIKTDEAFDALKKNSEQFGDLLSNVKGYRKTCEEGFKIVSTLVAATIIAKRAIVPFISTPLAGWVKTNFLEKGNTAQNASVDTVHNAYSYPGANPLCGNGCSNYLDIYKKSLMLKGATNNLKV